MSPMWLDLSQRNERDEILLMEGSPRKVVKAMNLFPGGKVVVEDNDFRIPGVIVVKSRGMFVKLDWSQVVYKPMAGRPAKNHSGVV